MRSQLRRTFITLEGAALLVGTVFGAGFLILPYAALKAGLVISLFWLGLFSLIVTLLHLMYSEIVLAGDKEHRLPGYAQKYLGQGGRRLAVVTFVFGVFGGLLVYLLLGGHFLFELILKEFNVSPLWSTVIFWAVLTNLALFNIKLSSRYNLGVTIATMAILVGVSFLALGASRVENFALPASASLLFPYGIILFSLVGYIAIPEVIKLLKEENISVTTNRPIIIGSGIFVALLSGLFMVAILGASGPGTSGDAISGLAGILPIWAVKLGLLLAFLEIATSYFVFGVSVRETLKDDFGVRESTANFAITALPMAFFLLGVTDFVSLISYLGAIWIGIDSILILLIWQKAKKINVTKANFLPIPSWLAIFMAILFAFGGMLALFFG